MGYHYGMAIRASMNVSVTPELERFVQELVDTGRYHSASEVFREGLRLLEQAERRRLLEKWFANGLTPEEQSRIPEELLVRARSSLQAKIQEGLDALDGGDVVDGEEFFANWEKRLKSPGAGKAKNQRGPKVKRRR